MATHLPRIPILVAVVFSILFTDVIALAASPARPPYELHDVLSLALSRNPALASASSVVDQRRGEQVSASAYPNPSINGEAGRGSIRDPSTGVSIVERTVTVQQPLEWPAKRAARQRAAAAGVAGALAGLDDTRLNVQTEVKVAFYQLLLAQRDADLADQNLRAVEEVAEIVKTRVRTGESAKFEGIKSNVEVQKARKELTRAQNALLVAKTKLDVLTGKALGQEFAIQGDFDAFPTGLDLPALIGRALDQHPSIRQQQKLVEQAGSTLAHERAARMPNVSVQGTYHREAGDEAITAGLSIPIPLWYRRQGEITTALGVQRQAEAEQERLRNELEQAVTQYYQEARTANDQIGVFEKGLLTQAKEALEIARFSFQHGATSLLEVLDAQRVYRQTLLEYAEARSGLSIALARLERSIGDLR